MKLILPIMLCLPLLSGCDAVADFVEPSISPTEQARLDVLEKRNDELQVELSASRDMATTWLLRWTVMAWLSVTWATKYLKTCCGSLPL